MKKEGRKKQARSYKPQNTPKAVTFLRKNELSSAHVHACTLHVHFVYMNLIKLHVHDSIRMIKLCSCETSLTCY